MPQPDGRGLSLAKAKKLFSPLAQNRLLAILGDSISHQNGTGNSLSARGYAVHACALARQKAVFLPSLNFGVAGETSPQIADRVGAVASSGADACVVLAGTNDLGYLATMTADQIYEQIVGSLETIYESLAAAGIFCFAVPILPRSAWGSYTSGQIIEAAQTALRVNTWLEKQAQIRSLDAWILVPSNVPLTNIDSTAYGIISGTTVDNLHPSSYGAFLMAEPLAAAIEWRYPDSPSVTYSRADAKSLANPAGNILANGIMRGTGGTAGTGTSGPTADGWGIARTSGTQLTGTLSKEAWGPNGTGSKQVIALSSALGGALEALTMSQTVNASAATFGAGDVLQAEFEVEQTGLSNVLGMTLEIQESDGATSLDYCAYQYQSETNAQEPVNADRRFRTVPFTVRPYAGSGTQRLIAYITVYAKCDSGTVGGSIKVKQIALRKVE